MKILCALFTAFLAIQAPLAAQTDAPPKPSMDSLQALASTLKWQTGTVTLKDGLAKINLTNDFRFLDHDDAEKVLHDMWGNQPNPEVLGLIFPADLGPLDHGSWAVAVEYEEGGYVKDDDAEKINYSDLLQQMQKSIEDHKAELAQQGYPTYDLVGWAAPPHYDKATHKLYWAKDIKFSDATADTLNYNIRVLGRHGVLVLNAIAAMDQFPEIDAKMPEVIAMVDFQPGNEYADFDPKIDKVAKYGLATLVAGGVLGAAAKFGLLKGLWVALLALKKFVVIGVVAAVAGLKKIMSKFSGKHSTPDHLLPPKQ